MDCFNKTCGAVIERPPRSHERQPGYRCPGCNTMYRERSSIDGSICLIVDDGRDGKSCIGSWMEYPPGIFLPFDICNADRSGAICGCSEKERAVMAELPNKMGQFCPSCLRVDL